MRMINLLPALVPIVFFIIGAVTWVFTREAESLPTRTTKNPGGDRQNPRFPTAQARKYQDVGRVAPNLAPTSKSGLPNRNQDIVILESNSPQEQEHGSRRGPGAKRQPKPRVRQESKERRERSAKSIGLNRSMGESIGETVGTGLVLSPLELPPSPLLHQNSGLLAPIVTDMTPLSNVMPERERDLQSLLRSRTRLQEALILSEILQPPVANRSRRKHFR